MDRVTFDTYKKILPSDDSMVVEQKKDETKI